MADLNIGVTIGGAVSQTFTNAMRTAERNVNSFRSNAERGGRQIGDAFRSTEQRLNNISRSARTAGASIGSMANAHNRAATAAQHHLSIMQRLGNAIRNIRLENVVRGTTATIGAIGGAIAGGVAVHHFFDKPKDAAANFDQIVTRALKKENIYGFKKDENGEYIKDNSGNYVRDEKPINDLKNKLMGIANQFNTSGDKVAQSLDTLMGAGKSLGVSLKALPSMIKFAVASESSIEDAAALTATLLNMGIAADKLEEAYAAMVVGGKEGAFEVKDMVQSFPNLLPDLKQAGFEGQELVLQAVAMAQTMRKVAGTSEEAAVYMKNYIEKLTDTASTNRFNKVLKELGMGDYGTELGKRIKSKGNIVSASIALVDDILAKKTGIRLDPKLKETDPEKYAQQEKQLEAAANSLELGKLYAEQRAKSGVLAMRYFGKEFDETMDKMRNTDGKKLIDLDFQAEMNSQAGIKGQKEAADTNQKISAGEAMAETTKSMDLTLKNIYQKLEDFWKTDAGKVVGTIAEPVGTIGGAVASGVGGLVAGGLLTGGTQGAANTIRGIGSVGRSAMSVAGRAISSTAGRALGAVGAVGLGAYRAYNIYENRENMNAEKQGEGYGSAIGGTGGALAGVAAGAAIGSMVPVIGTVIGGIIGGAVGGGLGDYIGGTLGKEIGKYADKNVVANNTSNKVMPEDKNEKKAKPIHTEIIKAETKTEKDNEPKIVNNTDYSQHPVHIITHVTVQGNADDPAKIASEIYPHIEQKIKDVQARQQANSVFDNR